MLFIRSIFLCFEGMSLCYFNFFCFYLENRVTFHFAVSFCVICRRFDKCFVTFVFIIYLLIIKFNLVFT